MSIQTKSPARMGGPWTVRTTTGGASTNVIGRVMGYGSVVLPSMAKGASTMPSGPVQSVWFGPEQLSVPGHLTQGRAGEELEGHHG